MADRFINESGLKFLESSDWFNYFNIYGYPILGVVWNVSLLLIPYVAVKALYRVSKIDSSNKPFKGLSYLIIFGVWLLFIPNSAYIISDVRHLATSCSAVNFYKICAESAWLIPIFFLYGSFGWISFVYLLNSMRQFLDSAINRSVSTWIIYVSIPLTSLGVLMGLLNRLNSWEAITRPSLVLSAARLYFTDIAYFKNWIIYSIVLYILYFTGDKISKKK